MTHVDELGLALKGFEEEGLSHDMNHLGVS